VLFSAAMQIAQAAIEKFGEAMGPAVDGVTGWTKTMNKATMDLAKTSRGGTGGTAEIAGQQASIGLGVETEALTQRARLLAGSQNLREVQSQLRADMAAGREDNQTQGLTGFRNGLFSGIPGLEALSWIGQEQGLDEIVKGMVGRRPTTGYYGFSGSRFEDQGIALPTVTDIGEAMNKFFYDMNILGTADERDVQTASFEKNVTKVTAQLNDDLARMSPLMGEYVGNLGEASKAVDVTATALEAAGLPEMAQAFREGQMAFVGANGQPVSDADTLKQVLEDTLLGQNRLDWSRSFSRMIPQVTAQVRDAQRQSLYQENVSVPARFYQSTLSQPIMPANFGVQPSFGTSTFGGPLSATGVSSKWIGQNQGLVDEQEALRSQGRSVMFDRIMRGRGFSEVPNIIEDGAQKTLEWAKNFGEVALQMAEVEALSQEIADLQIADTNKQQAMQQEQYNEQLRLSVRGAGDALAIAGKLGGAYREIVGFTEKGQAITEQATVQATKYGALQRAQMMDQRELSRISLARNQRELNMQLALARLRSPGETAAERAVRRREAEALAKEQQRMLDINKRSTSRGFQIQDIQLSRNAKDVLKQLELTTGQRTLQIDLQGSQAHQKFLSRTLALQESLLGIGDAVGEQIDKIVMGAWTQLESATGEWRDVFTEETGTLMDITFKAAKTKYSDFLDWLGRKNDRLEGGKGGTATPESGPNTGLAPGTQREVAMPVGGGSSSYPHGGGEWTGGSGLTRQQLEKYISNYMALGHDKQATRDYLEAAYGVSVQRTNFVGNQMAEAGKISKWATGGIFSANQATGFIAGEAGSESVIVIRNPKVGAVGGGGGGSVNININASVRNDSDVDALVRKVVREIHSQSELVV